jgi:hypothetical protein
MMRWPADSVWFHMVVISFWAQGLMDAISGEWGSGIIWWRSRRFWLGAPPQWPTKSSSQSQPKCQGQFQNPDSR